MRELIFHVGHSAGFYSEFNNMVLAILYCRRHNIDFKLYSRDANFGYDKGWQDFFLPFCEESTSIVHHYINKRFEVPSGGKRKLLYNIYKQIFPNSYITPELWNNFRHIDQTELPTVEVRNLSRLIIDQVYRFNAETQSLITDLMNNVKLNEPYIGFHIRGGDKVSEHKLIQAQEYIHRAEQLSEIRLGFIYTDDYSYYENLCKEFPHWTFYTLTLETDHGYFHNDFVKQSKDVKKQKLINMFASMEYLSRAEMTLCTFSSNPGMFLGMRMGDKAIGMDFEKWMIW